MVGEVPLEALLVGRQSEEPVLLGQPLERHVRVVRADRPAGRLLDLGGAAEALVRAVPALVGAEIDVAVGMRPADHLLGRLEMVGVGRPDEPVGRDLEGRLRGAEEGHVRVDEVARRPTLLGRPLDDVDGVLVGPGQKARGRAEHPVPAGDDVRADDVEQGVQTRLVVGVGDRRGQVEPVRGGHGRPMVAGAVGRPDVVSWRRSPPRRPRCRRHRPPHRPRGRPHRRRRPRHRRPCRPRRRHCPCRSRSSRRRRT